MRVDEISQAFLRCDLDARILTITFDRPAKMNALSYPMLAAFLAALKWGDQSREVRAIIVTGEGKAFSSGTDLSDGEDAFVGHSGLAPAKPGDAEPDYGGVINLQIYRSSKPVLAAINGVAVGFGSTMTLPMDFRYAAENASFIFVFARRGLMPEACSTWFLPRVVGITRALDWTLRARTVSAQEALQAGLLNEIVPAAELLNHVRRAATSLIEDCAANSLLAIRRSLWTMSGSETPEAAHRLESHGMVLLKTLPDFEEAVAAFRRKAPTRFSGLIDDRVRSSFDRWLGTDDGGTPLDDYEKS